MAEQPPYPLCIFKVRSGAPCPTKWKQHGLRKPPSRRWEVCTSRMSSTQFFAREVGLKAKSIVFPGLQCGWLGCEGLSTNGIEWIFIGCGGEGFFLSYANFSALRKKKQAINWWREDLFKDHTNRCPGRSSIWIKIAILLIWCSVFFFNFYNHVEFVKDWGFVNIFFWILLVPPHKVGLGVKIEHSYEGSRGQIRLN